MALERASAAVLACPEAERRIANATVFLDAFGHVGIGWLWLWQAQIAEARLAEALPEAEQRFYSAKLAACLYFALHELPLAIARLNLCASLEAPALDCAPELFG